LNLYYGAADTSIALATARISELLAWLDCHSSASEGIAVWPPCLSLWTVRQREPQAQAKSPKCYHEETRIGTPPCDLRRLLMCRWRYGRWLTRLQTKAGQAWFVKDKPGGKIRYHWHHTSRGPQPRTL